MRLLSKGAVSSYSSLVDPSQSCVKAATFIKHREFRLEIDMNDANAVCKRYFYCIVFQYAETSCIGFGNSPKSPTTRSGYFFLDLGAGKSLSQAVKCDRNLDRCVYNARF